MKGLKNNKAAGPDGLPSEVFKHDGYHLLHRLHRFITSANGCVPQQWKDANIVTVYKRKGDKALCGNSRGISLLSVAGNVLARVMLWRQVTHVVDIVMPELQSGFRRGRGTIDMIFVARLLQEKCHESDPFDVLVGVKQGCVLAPVIFNLFLVAVTLVFRNGLPSNAGIPINFRLDGNLFNIRRLQTNTKVSSDTSFDLQYADDAAIPSHTAVGLQHSLDLLAATYQRAGLIVNTKKTEVLTQSVNTSFAAHRTFTVHGDSLNDVHQFTYLGSILTSDCDLNNEIQQRVKLASAAVGRLSHRVFLNHNLAIATKIAVYKAICISILLYGCESWTPYRLHIKTLEAFHIRCLKSILGIHWGHKVTHVEIRHRAAGIDSAEHLLLQRQLRWVRHVICMPSNRLPRRILCGELVNGQRLPGGPKLRYLDHIRRILNKCNISTAELQQLSTD